MKTFAGIVLLIGLIIPGGFAAADTFTLDNYTITTNLTDPGLVVHSASILDQPKSWNLGVGDSITFDLFKIWTNETDVGTDDTVPRPISVSFDWDAPADINGVSSGTTVGQEWGLFGFYQAGVLSWNGPVSYLFGNGGEFQIALSDETFNEGSWWTGLDEGECKGAIVEATLTYTSASVPEPTTLLLLGSGLVGLAGLKRRLRK